MDEIATASGAFSFEWVEKAHGFTFTSPRHFLQVARPEVKRRNGNGQMKFFVCAARVIELIRKKQQPPSFKKRKETR
jgi:hypothetical protein